MLSADKARRWRRGPGLATGALVLALGMIAPPAGARDAALAESLFREGRTLLESGHYSAALTKLEESFAQDPATGTLLALAVCQERLGMTASAWASYSEAAARAEREGGVEREKAARERKAALEPKLSWLTVTASDEALAVEGLVVKRDGVELGRGALGSAAAIDPGEHVVEASAPGREPWKRTITVGEEADRQTLEIPAPRELGTAPPSEAAPAPASTSGGDPGADSGGSGGSSLRTIGIVTGGVGLVGLGIGGFFGIRAFTLNDQSSSDCNERNECNDAGFKARTDAGTAADVSTVAFVAGGVLTALGATLFIVGGSDDEAVAVHAAPVVGPRTAGATLRGRF